MHSLVNTVLTPEYLEEISNEGDIESFLRSAADDVRDMNELDIDYDEDAAIESFKDYFDELLGRGLE